MWKYIASFLATVTVGAGGTIAADNRIDPYTDKGDRVEIAQPSTIEAAGEVKAELSKAEPAVTLSKWNGEAALTVKYENVKGEGERAFLTDRMEWKDLKGKEEVHAYPLEAKEGMEDGGFEIEVVLNEKPDTNVFDFKIEGAEELDFFYQPPLDEEPLDQNSVSCTQTECVNAEGERSVYRPENIVGSYAVYHKTKLNHTTSDLNYGTGKLYHIYRPKVIDANDVEVWGVLSYANGTLSVTVPQEFLDAAEYPVVVDPTFGNTGLGTSGVNNGGNASCSYFDQGQLAGTVTTITAMLNNTTTNGGAYGMAIYNADATPDPTTKIAEDTGNGALTTTQSWHTLNVSATIVAATPYYLCVFMQNAAGVEQLWQDSSTGGVTDAAAPAFESWPSPFVTTGATSRRYSIYATYTCTTSTCNFGSFNDDLNVTIASTDNKITSPATPNSSGTVASLSCRLWLTVGGSSTWRGVIYSDSAGSPTNLLAVTDDTAISNTSESVVTANFSGANLISITSGTQYWIGFHVQDPGAASWNISRDAAANQRVTNGDDVFSGGSDNPHTADKSVLSGPINCYVSFTIGGAGGAVMHFGDFTTFD